MQIFWRFGETQRSGNSDEVRQVPPFHDRPFDATRRQLGWDHQRDGYAPKPECEATKFLDQVARIVAVPTWPRPVVASSDTRFREHEQTRSNMRLPRKRAIG
jgi:hypothetical protein